MALIPKRPFGGLDRFFGDEEDWILPILPNIDLSKPAMDVYETKKEVVAKVNIPGFDPDVVEVTVENGVLRVSGSIDQKEEKGYWRREIRKQSFERAVQLPVPVKEDKAKASCEKGVLTVTIPKEKESKLSKITVENKDKENKK